MPPSPQGEGLVLRLLAASLINPPKTSGKAFSSFHFPLSIVISRRDPQKPSPQAMASAAEL
jgi:hypothetical protein